MDVHTSASTLLDALVFFVQHWRPGDRALLHNPTVVDTLVEHHLPSTARLIRCVHGQIFGGSSSDDELKKVWMPALCSYSTVEIRRSARAVLAAPKTRVLCPVFSRSARNKDTVYERYWLHREHEPRCVQPLPLLATQEGDNINPALLNAGIRMVGDQRMSFAGDVPLCEIM